MSETRRAQIEREAMARYYVDGAEATLRQLFDRIAELEEEVERLREALASYTDATTVQSYAYEEDRDIGHIARRELGYGDHEPSCLWPDSEVCTCGLENRIRADFGMKEL